MTAPSVSIVLSCYRRGLLLRKTLESIRRQNIDPEIIVVEDGDDGKTEFVARDAGAKYFRKDRADLPAFQNPSKIHNIGIKQATGKVVVLMGGEVKFETIPNGLADLVAPVFRDDTMLTTPLVQGLDEHGKFANWLVHPSEGERAGWIINFCIALRRGKLFQIGGFEEAYSGYGYEDDQLMFSLRRIGVVPTYVPSVLVSHQYHTRKNYEFGNPEGKAQFEAFLRQVAEGCPPVANVGRDWGRSR